jgi:hypothetical protein
MCRPTRPCSGWSKDAGAVPIIRNPSDCHRCTAGALDSTTALNWMLAKPGRPRWLHYCGLPAELYFRAACLADSE